MKSTSCNANVWTATQFENSSQLNLDIRVPWILYYVRLDAVLVTFGWWVEMNLQVKKIWEVLDWKNLYYWSQDSDFSRSRNYYGGLNFFLEIETSPCFRLRAIPRNRSHPANFYWDKIWVGFKLGLQVELNRKKTHVQLIMIVENGAPKKLVNKLDSIIGNYETGKRCGYI